MDKLDWYLCGAGRNHKVEKFRKLIVGIELFDKTLSLFMRNQQSVSWNEFGAGSIIGLGFVEKLISNVLKPFGFVRVDSKRFHVIL